MDLFYRELGEGKPVIILHGVFGFSDNWITIGKQLATQYKVLVLDQRNHGQSPHSEEFSYKAMVDDLYSFIDSQKLEMPAIIGHSMGGKVAMHFAVNHPDKLAKLIVVDIGPKAYEVDHDHILEGLSSIDLYEIKSRKSADEQLALFVKEEGVRQFLLKNLARNKDGTFRWKLNLPVLKREISTIGQALPENVRFEKQTLFVRGETSGYIKDEDHHLIKHIFPQAEIQTVSGAGHWVHADKPELFLKAVLEFLDR